MLEEQESANAVASTSSSSGGGGGRGAPAVAGSGDGGRARSSDVGGERAAITSTTRASKHADYKTKWAKTLGADYEINVVEIMYVVNMGWGERGANYDLKDNI